MDFDDLSHRVIGCAIEVHRALGAGYSNLPTNSVLLTNSRKTGFGFNFNIRNQLSTQTFNVTNLKDGIKRFVL